jgi:hypothetical protein
MLYVAKQPLRLFLLEIHFNLKGLAQVVKALVLRAYSLQGSRFNTLWV